MAGGLAGATSQRTTWLLSGALSGLIGVSVLGADVAAASEWEWGGDLRLRMVEVKEVPAGSAASGPIEIDQLFTRTRTRAWVAYRPHEQLEFRARLMNEFRFYGQGRAAGNAEEQEPLSEVIPDLLYVDWTGLAGGRIDLRIGRQELIYGTGRILLNGTPLDGSRTLFYNAVKARLAFDPEHTIDFLALYNEDDDSLTLNSQPSLTVIEHDEAALGFYGRNLSNDEWPFEYYWIYKEEDRAESAEFHTVGARFFPEFGRWAFNVELATQYGEHGTADLEGRMLDASATYRPDVTTALAPALHGGYYYLSGNDPESADNEGWYPVFSRWPQLSELYIYSYVGAEHGVAGWSNLHAPFLGLDLTPFSGASLQLRYHWLLADEEDGPGEGSERGQLATALLGVRFSEQFGGHLLIEHLSAGDYYLDDANDGLFVRAHVDYTF
ncbi:hypothetical protein CKO15_12140 [Halorhodospira abdelmalekii]|uniref:alginate export family protein n=1 Tax=Halorhodospira abdelmalekii TaxID=421629 RepID=UPI001902EB0B|nr:alginate export family protein [Halorhodospira abdelmalekii]MBK1736012.1 hypothetical protein [Halorhodospira abdelmalekii]